MLPFYFSGLSIPHFRVCIQIFQDHPFLYFIVSGLFLSFIYYMPLKLFFLRIFLQFNVFMFSLFISVFHSIGFSNLFCEINYPFSPLQEEGAYIFTLQLWECFSFLSILYEFCVYIISTLPFPFSNPPNFLSNS